MQHSYAPLVSYTSELHDDDQALQSGNPPHAAGLNGAVVRRNRSISIKDQQKHLSVQEELVLVDGSIERQAMELQLQEARRRTEEQTLVLDMRTQQLLNYTHEHVSQTRQESERRMSRW
ncbi:hypothetical protein PHYSODRAFT_326492 [Phytophthora sojae]|uniref:Uncharacterized protein n=1 Tax=Phytophthora sojae (strain P6497) TaxID=1094619 RepID=G4YUM7_PHYSP|nr:hypothetical protein PHYSODRAFT_326492 [Phytophthora sojae]EGZ25482.1 hypothetical protein PHYSODRAFT_326492 [Phytophthora sojae]|eukprot:XP_009520770.1 hypothetical protein PHYSODRAFT_326492 [Phytophthora sojae]